MQSKGYRPPLVRSKTDRMVAGVASGLAAHLKLQTSWVRITLLILTLFGGTGVMIYLFLLVTMPEEGEVAASVPIKKFFTPAASGATTNQAGAPKSLSARRLPLVEIFLGGALLIAGFALIAAQIGLQVRLEIVLPALAVLVGVGLTWWLIADRETPEKNYLPRILAALSLVAVGVLMFFLTANEPSAFTVIGAALAVLAGVGFAIAPWLLRLNRELVAERSARAREAERAEIAAHLHDSVMQTLALIQQRAEPGAEVARLARAQERELRQWLFRSAESKHGSHSEASSRSIFAVLNEHAAVLEKQYAVKFDVINVGGAVEGTESLVLAAREAMLNAARHAGGDVTVYIESGQNEISIDINDRGEGFDLERIDASRFGVRESILGRMRRAGGSATVKKGPGEKGTFVHLSQPRSHEKEPPQK